MLFLIDFELQLDSKDEFEFHISKVSFEDDSYDKNYWYDEELRNVDHEQGQFENLPFSELEVYTEYRGAFDIDISYNECGTFDSPEMESDIEFKVFYYWKVSEPWIVINK